MNHRYHKINLSSTLVFSIAHLEKVKYQRCLIQDHWHGLYSCTFIKGEVYEDVHNVNNLKIIN